MATAHPCEVLLNTEACKFPPVEDLEGSCMSRCYRCGKRACRGCARLIPSGVGRQRRKKLVCADCNGDYWKDAG